MFFKLMEIINGYIAEKHKDGKAIHSKAAFSQ
jgi:hypothetical protein